jgi:chromosome segregation ATPase
MIDVDASKSAKDFRRERDQVRHQIEAAQAATAAALEVAEVMREERDETRVVLFAVRADLRDAVKLCEWYEAELVAVREECDQARMERDQARAEAATLLNDRHSLILERDHARVMITDTIVGLTKLFQRARVGWPTEVNTIAALLRRLEGGGDE